LATNQVEASLLHTAPLFDGTFDQAQTHRLRPMVWSPMGNLFQRDDAAAARVLAALEAISPNYGHPGHDVLLLAWLLRHPALPLPVLGTARKERLIAATQALDTHLTDADWFTLLAAATGQEVA
jgi:predicted oxidoreductase